MEIHYNNDPMFDDWVSFLKKTKNIPQTNLPIYIGRNYFDKKCVLFNIEQNTRNDFNSNNFKNSNIVEIWDYSVENIRIFKENNIHNVKHVPFCLWDEYRNQIESYNINNNYDFDVVFIGWINKRREKILDELTKNGLKVKTITQRLFGKERDEIISKSKILLNIHFEEDYKIFELYRCFPWIETKKIVVSENSLDNDNRCINVNYENIVDKILEIINNKNYVK
jgi:hypothetical protein